MHKYKEVAARIVKETNIKVNIPHAEVTLLADGAFVECRIWIPKLEMEKYKL